MAWGKQKRALQPKLIAKRMGYIKLKHAAATVTLEQRCQEVLKKTPEAGEDTILCLDLQIKAMTEGEAWVRCLQPCPSVTSLGLDYISHGLTLANVDAVTMKASWSGPVQSLRSWWSILVLSNASLMQRSCSPSGARTPGRRWPGLWQQ